MDYIEYCETLFMNSIDNNVELSENFQKLFDLEAIPEPYLRFSGNQENGRTLYFLTTNPGGSMEFQNINNLRTCRPEVININESYYHNSQILAEYYKVKLKGLAGQRINTMCDLALNSGYNNVTQIEVLPYHSPKLPNKDKVAEMISSDATINNYIRVVKDYLSDKDCFYISAAPKEISIDCVNSHRWFKLIMDILGINPDNSEIIPILHSPNNTEKVTSALILGNNRKPLKGIFMTMGNNRLPAINNLCRIQDILRQSSR